MEGEAETVVGSCSKPCGPLEDYYIPDYILKPGAQQVLVDHAAPCPIVVFINSRSGGQLGSSLIKTYRELLNEAQVPFVFLEMLDHGNMLLVLIAF
jgi:diacylglycerol kinase (ATP)